MYTKTRGKTFFGDLIGKKPAVPVHGPVQMLPHHILLDLSGAQGILLEAWS
jgi:hypothetical protein